MGGNLSNCTSNTVNIIKRGTHLSVTTHKAHETAFVSMSIPRDEIKQRENESICFTISEKNTIIMPTCITDPQYSDYGHCNLKKNTFTYNERFPIHVPGKSNFTIRAITCWKNHTIARKFEFNITHHLGTMQCEGKRFRVQFLPSNIKPAH